MRLLALSCFLFAATLNAESPKGFYRAPAIHGDNIVFSSEGDLWRVGVKGGVATRMTSHAGSENLAAISTDGQTIAFVGMIEGKAELYTMPMEGGVPQRRTFDNSEPRYISWTPDGRILYSTDKHSTLPDQQLVTLDAKTNARTMVPLSQASAGCYSPDGALFFVRWPKQGSSTKRYRGGWIENLWLYKGGKEEAVRLEPNDKSTSRSPMWWSDRVYFVSDRDGTLNLWSIKPDGSDARQHTKHNGNDVRNPSLDAGRIVYRLGADLRLYDIAQDKDTELKIQIVSDFDQRREHWVKKPFDYLTSWHVSPGGDRVALTARGEVFVAPFDPGRLVELPRKEGVRYRNASFMPDGKTLLMESDASDEIEFWSVPANGSEAPKQLSEDGHIFRFGGKVSPDGKWIAWSDKNLQLWVRNLASKENKLVATNRSDGELNDFEWSPNSLWLAFADEAPNTYQQIKLYNIADGKVIEATSDHTNSFSPAWSPDGKWLYFLSNREVKSMVQSPWGHWQPEPFYTETTKIYMLALHKGEVSPFRPANELSEPKPTTPTPAKTPPTRPPADAEASKKRMEEMIRPVVEKVVKELKDKADKPDAKAPEVKKAEPTKPAPPKPSIELDGLQTRLEEVPVSAGNYTDLSVNEKNLFFVNKPTGFNSKSALMRFEVSNKKHVPVLFVADTHSYELSAKNNKLAVRVGEKLWITDANGNAPAGLNNSAELNGWQFAIQPQEEWHQIYRESWRMLRDYFYDRDMHGVDWLAVRKKYEPLVDRVTERSDLNEIIADMLGELTALHLYVRHGDDRSVPDVIDTASLGAVLQRDEQAGGWRVQHLWKTDPDYPNKTSPLTRPGVEIVEGDVITRINGRSTLDVPHPDALLMNEAGKQVLLGVKHDGKERQVIMKPINAETDFGMRYDEWEYTRRLKVDELSQGKIGYVHLRAMGREDMEQWARDFYPQFKRQGLIIDVRHNRGGNIDSWVLEKLMRRAWSYFSPAVGESGSNMQYAFSGHLVALCDAKTASDGEAFCEGFRRLGLGKVTGTRTWGGQIWLSAERWLVDSGMATAAELGVFSPEGKWLIEGEGVHPDIEVDNPPHATFEGGDAQMEAAVKHLQELIAKDPRPTPTAPPHPKKVFSDDDKK